MLNYIKKIWNNCKQIIYILLILTIIFSVILILPAISKILINFKLFESFDELNSYISIYNNKYSIMFIVMGIIIMIFIFGDKEKIIEMLGQFSFMIKHGDTSVSITKADEFKDTESKKKLTEALYDESKENLKKEENENSKESIQKIKSILDLSNSKNKSKKKKKNEIDETKKVNENLKDENDSLRFYATYNIINKKTKELLMQIYYEKCIEQSRFKEVLIKNFQKNNKNNRNISKNNLRKYANDKYETIFKGLNYLKIIDLSEDNNEIRLTEKGKKFVDEYIIKERWFE